MNGLIETVALAIKLDRTLVLPKFYRHYRDPLAMDTDANNYTKFYQDAIDPEFRISVDSLRQLLPVVYISELRFVGKTVRSKFIGIIKLNFQTSQFASKISHSLSAFPFTQTTMSQFKL